MSSPPNPFALLLKTGLPVHTKFGAEAQAPKAIEVPLLRTVYYTYHEQDGLVNYPFEVVRRGAKGVEPAHVQRPKGFKVSTILEYLVDAWNRQRKWSIKGIDKGRESI